MQANRRQFLSSAISMGVGMSVLEPFASSAAGAATDPTAVVAPGMPDPNFFYGTIIKAGADGQLRGVDDFNAVWTLQMTAATSIWREGRLNASMPAAGEHLSARGLRQPDGSLRVDTCWCNIFKYDGWLRGVSPKGQLTIDSDQLGLVAVDFADVTEVVDPYGVASPSASPTALKVGEDVTAIGWKSADGGLHASRVLRPSDAAASAANAAAVKALAPINPAFAVQYAGVASYFTCNGGACGTCHTTSHQIAWPKMNGNLCGPSNGCSLPSNFASHSCSACFDAQNGCQSGIVRLQVADCGPNTRCRDTGCLHYMDVWFDLTQSAFTALGGSLSIGHLDLQLSAAFSC